MEVQMKKQWLILIFMLCVVSILFSIPVSINKATVIANHWINFKTVPMIQGFQIQDVLVQSLEDQPCFYVCNLKSITENKDGFILVSAQDSYHPIIGYSFDSKWDNTFCDEARIQFFNSIKHSVIESMNRNPFDSVIDKEWTDLISEQYSTFRDDRDVAPLVTTRWNQSPLYNNYCPSISGTLCPVGCTAVSMAQVIRYHSYPPQGSGSHSYMWHDQQLSADYGATTYNWSNMPNTLSGASTTQINATAQFLYQVGVSVNMDYGTDGSASWYSAEAFENYFTYPNTIQLATRAGLGVQAWKNLMRFELDRGRPMPYGNAYHAFVCDGYQGTEFFHFNLGWGGSADGYYLLTALNAGGYQFSFGQDALIGIENPGYPFPTNLTRIVIDNNIDLEWTGTPDMQCLGYKIYVNGLFVGQTSETYYIMPNSSPLERKSFFVTAYYLNGESVASNIVFLDAMVPSRFQGRSDLSICNDGGASEGSAWVDIDNDNDLDLVVANYSEPNFLYRNNGGDSFTRIIDGPLATDNRTTEGLTCGDYDNDGYVDFLLATLRDKNLLLHNDGAGNFTMVHDTPVDDDVTNCRGACFGDYDNDGNLDLFYGPNYLFHNEGNGVFSRVTTGPIYYNSGDASTSTWVDFNNDGLIDLHVFDSSSGSHRLFRNTGNGQFVIHSDPVFNTSYPYSRGASWGDYDNDGYDDVVITRYDGATNILLHNNGNGSFTRITDGPIFTSTGNGRGSAWADLDNDGDLDLIIVNFGESNLLFYNDGDGTFTRDTNDQIVQNGDMSSTVAVADYNRDGKLDAFVTNECFRNNMLYKNTGIAGNYLTIKCTGVVSNTKAIGTIIRVKANINGTYIWQKRTVSSQTGHETMNTFEQHFGLAQATTADSIIVTWPNGIIQTLTNVPANQYLTITETGSILHATISADNVDIDPGTQVQFYSHVQSYPSTVSSYQWWFDYESNSSVDSTEPNPTWAYTTPGYHTVRLAVTNADLSTTVLQEDMIYVNFFTPVSSTALAQGSMFTGISCPDYNNDGYPDLYLASAANQLNHALINDGNGNFTQASNLGLTAGNFNTITSTWADVNNDGYIEGYVANRGSQMDQFFMADSPLNWTNHISYLEGSIAENSMSATFADFDNNGSLYLIVAIGNGTYHRIWGDFDIDSMDLTDSFHITSNNANCMVCCDLNNDDFPDIFIANNGQNQLYNNHIHTFPNSFIPITGMELTDTSLNTISASAGDYDRDGDLDLFVTNANSTSSLYRNDGNFVFTPITNTTFGIQSYLARGSSWCDFDNDGWLDIILVNNSGPIQLYHNQGNSTFKLYEREALSANVHNSNGIANADFDRDGSVDFIVMHSNPVLYKNAISNNHWFELNLEGMTYNKSAIGAKTIISYMENGQHIQQRQDVFGQTGYASQNSLIMHFGLGSATVIDTVTTYWYSGIITREYNVPADQYMHLRQDGTVLNSDPMSQPFALKLGNYPNPFNPNTTINFDLQQTGSCTIEIFNVRGQKVIGKNFEELKTGHHEWQWNGTDYNGKSTSSGIYFCRLTADNKTISHKMVLLK
jgi:enediyne biosynthesis protein E4